jgi:predicted RNA-binding Zn ribbon-like protein
MPMAEQSRWPRLVGGHPALDLVNTDVVSEHDRSADVMRSAREFLDWCAFAGLETPAPAAGDATAPLAEAAALRAALRSLFESVAKGEEMDADALRIVRETCADAVAHAEARFVDSRLSWTWPPTAARAQLWSVAFAAVELLRSGPAGRIKLCPGCGFVFLDTSRSGSRRWCSMDDCGNDEKGRRYVAKRAAARGARP